MKKLLGIIVLGLLLGGNAYAKLITLKKCYTTKFKSSDDRVIKIYKSFAEEQKIVNSMDDQLYTLDTESKTITYTIVWSENAIENHAKYYNGILPKIHKTIYKIIDLGGNFATAIPAEKDGWVKEEKINVDFENSKVYLYITSDLGAGMTTVSRTEQCQKQR